MSATTSSQLPVSARLRSLARRLGAMLYDGLVLLALMIVLTVLVVMATGAAVPAGFVPYQLALAAVATAFYLWFWTRRRQTVGMRAWRLELVRADGAAPGLRDAALRLAASLLSLGALGAGYLWILFDAQGLAWHDRLSGTRIVFVPAAAPARP